MKSILFNFLFVLLLFEFFTVSSTSTTTWSSRELHDISCAGECSDIANATCNSNHTCECEDKFIPSSDLTRCLPVSPGYLSPCEDNRQCSESLLSGGQCLDGLCQCGIGYHYYEERCWRSIGLGEPCKMDEECYANSETLGLVCSNSQCQCNDTYYQREHSSCRLKDGNCLLQSDCKDCCNTRSRACGVKNIFGNCKVRSLTKANLDVVEQNVLQIDSPCSTTAECLQGIGHSECINQVCICERNIRVPSPDQKTCLKVANGEIDFFNQTTCLYDNQCNVFGPRGICDVNKRQCMCDDASYWEPTEKYCWVSKLHGESCLEDKDCAGHSNMTCRSNVCQCMDGNHAADDGKGCREDKANIGDECFFDSDCIFSNSKCNIDSQICTCNDTFYAKDGVCIEGLGSECTDACSVSLSECVQQGDKKICKCSGGLVDSSTYGECLTAVGYNETCKEDSQCQASMGALSICNVDGTCDCGEDAHYSPNYGQCYTKKLIGDKCSAQGECFAANLNSTVCLNGVCRCKYGYIMLSDTECSGSEIIGPSIFILLFFIIVEKLLN